MAIARYKQVVVDAGDVDRLGQFWAAALHRTWRPRGGRYGFATGPTPEHTVWVNAVPERKTVKNRVHLDIYAQSLADLEALGATFVERFPRWTVMADPEGGEFCAFLRDDVPEDRLHGLVVDCADPVAQASWWGTVYGVDVIDKDQWATLEGVPGMPIQTMDFVPVPEPKKVKNRIHWDVTIPSVDSVTTLISAGATLLRGPDDEIYWHVLADPEGNEFCAFLPR